MISEFELYFKNFWVNFLSQDAIIDTLVSRDYENDLGQFEWK